MTHTPHGQSLIRIAAGSILVSLVVLGLKVLAWQMTGSVALMSDALESTVNVATAIAALIAIRVAERPADAEHPYGHHKAEFFSAVLEGVLIIVAALVLLLKLLLDAYLKTRAGFLLRAVGDNETVVTSLARDKGNVKIAGLVLANALVALSGAVLCQSQRMFEVSMGTGAMVMGLASVIIGVNLLRRLEWVKQTSAVITGAILYRLSVAFAISMGLAPMDMKLITAALFLGILAAGNLKKEKKHA